MRRRRKQRHDGIVVAASCTECAGELGEDAPIEDGRCMVIVHAAHAAALEALGWIRTPDDDPNEPDDVCCPHYHAAHWQD